MSRAAGNHRRLIAIALAVCALVSIGYWPALICAGVLDDARSEVRQPAPQSNTSDSSCDDDDGWGQFLWDITFGTLSHLLFAGGSDATVDYNDKVRFTHWFWLPTFATQFADYPYSDGVSGIVLGPEDTTAVSGPYSARVAFDYGNDFDDLARYGGSALVEWKSGLGIDSEAHWYREATFAGNDDLAVGDANLLFRLIETKHTVWRFGFGMNWLADDTDSDLGANLTLRADLFPIRPIIVTGQIDAGTLGSAGQFHGRVTTGVNLRHCELFIGYDYRAIGDAELEGPLAGLQFWF